jgi:transposase
VTPLQDDSPGQRKEDDTVWVTDALVEAELSTKREEGDRLRLVSEARRQSRQDGTARAWRWNIEPGMEGAFRHLLGWLLSSQREAPAEMAAAVQPEATTTAQVPTPLAAKSVDSVRCCGYPSACCAGGS